MPQSSDDRDTEEALKEFDFLVTSEEGDSESRSAGDGTDWGKEGYWIQPETLCKEKKQIFFSGGKHLKEHFKSLISWNVDAMNFLLPSPFV